MYLKVHGIISQPPVKDYVPYSWVSLTQVKREHYKALAHYFVALGLLDHKEKNFPQRAKEILQFLHEEEEEDKTSTLTDIRVPKTLEEKRYLGKKQYFSICT